MNVASGVAGSSRAANIVLFAPSHMVLPTARDVRAHGRRDGNSKQRKPFEGRRRPERRREETSTSEAWWEEPSQQQRPEPQQQQQQQRQQQQTRWDYREDREDRRRSEQDEDDEGQGWWQKAEERTLQAYAPDELTPRQIKRLEEAFAQGRRKVKVQELGQELGLDRTEVIHWMKQFSLRPDSERQAIISQRQKDMQRAAEEAKNEPQPMGRGWSSALEQQEQPSTQGQQGFIPFYTRKEMGLVDYKHRRLSADALRTLETVYSRNPYPPDDVIKGMWDLHRVNRETTLQWLTARREQDGLATTSDSRRRPKDETAMSPAKLREAMGSVGYDRNNLMVKLGGEEALPAVEEQPQAPTVVAITGRQLAMLKSSLPSPNKHKGRARNEKMGIKNEGESLQVGAVQYVKEQVPAHAMDRWTAGWRIKKAVRTRRLLPLLISKGE